MIKLTGTSDIRGTTPTRIMLKLSALAIVCLLSSCHVTALNTISSEQKEANNAIDMTPVENARSRYVFSKLFDFDYFKTTFQKSYDSIMDEMVRKRLFLGRAFRAFISAVEYKFGFRSSYLGINAMSDWTPNEINRLYSPRLRNTNKLREFVGGNNNKGDEVGLPTEKNESELPAVDEKELAGTLEKMNEYSDEPGFKEIIQMLKTETLRRVKRETHEVRGISLDDLFKEPTQVEEDSSSDQIPSNNPEYIAPELRSHGSGKQGDRMGTVPKLLVQKILDSSGAKFMAETINDFTSKFGRLSRKKSKPAAFEQRISLPRDKSDEDERDLTSGQQSVEVDPISQGQLFEKQFSRRTLGQQSASQVDVMLPSSPSNNQQMTERQMLLMKIKDKIRLVVENIMKQLERHKSMQDQGSVTDAQAQSNSTEPTMMTPQQERMMRQRAELEKSLQALLTFDDSIEKIKSSEKFTQLPPTISNSILKADHGGQYSSAQVNKPLDMVFIDHRLSNCFFPPRDQGFCGACYAFATIALYEWAYCMETGKKVAFSEQYVVDCGESFDSINFKGCEGGAITNIPYFVRHLGLETRQNYPYTQIEDLCPYEQMSNRPETMGYIRVNQHSLERVNYHFIDHALQGGPLVVNLYTNLEFAEYGGGVDAMNNCDPQRVHSVLLIGSGREDGRDYWLFRNSHGKVWGQGGYYKIQRYSPCMDYQNLLYLASSFGNMYPKYANQNYDEEKIKSSQKSKAMIDYESDLNVQSELVNIVKMLRAVTTP